MQKLIGRNEPNTMTKARRLQQLNRLGIRPEQIGKPTLSKENQRRLDKELLKAAEKGDFARIKELTTKGADVNMKNRYGSTPLHRVAFEGHLEPLRFLIKKGADTELKTCTGWTPLHLAAWNRHPNALRILIREGANVNAKTDHGETALDLASGAEEAQVLKKTMKGSETAEDKD